MRVLFWHHRGTMPPQIEDWAGLVNQRDDLSDQLVMTLPIDQSAVTWGGPFRAAASDGQNYFVKTLDTCPPGQGASLAVEMIVARLGRVIGAPMCDTRLLRIPPELAGWEPRPGVSLTPGLAHASKALEHADEERPALAARAQDDNRRRHVGIYAAYDWFIGDDQQWLYDIDDDRKIYSHDHGLYLPPIGGGGFEIGSLVASVDIPHQLPDPTDNLLPAAIAEVAAALRALSRDTIVSVLNLVPPSWPVTDPDLEALGWFLEVRAPAVADRLQSIST